MKISKMKIKVAGLCLLTWAFVSTSCSDYLDKTPDDATSITLEEVFSSEIYTERFLLRAYDYLPCETNDNEKNMLKKWIVVAGILKCSKVVPVRVRLMQCGGVIMKVSVNVMCFLKI